MPKTCLALDEIKSLARYVVHGRDGLISEHRTANDAIQSLVLRAEDFPRASDCVYRRDVDYWTLLYWVRRHADCASAPNHEPARISVRPLGRTGASASYSPGSSPIEVLWLCA